MNGGEKAIFDKELNKFYYVDGFCSETSTILEFYGCLFHACTFCFDCKNEHILYSERRMGDVYKETIEREKRLSLGTWGTMTIWEHDYRKLKETDEMKRFLDMVDIVTDLEPRDAFFGGRVNGFKLFRDVQEDETIEYVDFTSLYPFVNKTKKYPIGHPMIIRENFEDISNYFGLIKCKVLAPAKLYHPVLPVRTKGKLFFPLCKLCVMGNSSECRHSEEERSFWGTFTTIEVEKAIEKGYRIIQINEIWHFENSSSDLFSEYVNYFLRVKQESSGFPEWAKTTEDQAKYVQEYYKHEGVSLRLDKIMHNPGLRAFAKLCLNSLWGKFCQKDDRLNTEFVNDPLQFYKRINGADVEMHDLCILNDDLVELVFKRKHEYKVENKLTNIFIGIFTTAWARLELYNVMDLLKEDCLYVDTDSCIYVNRPGGPKPPLGDYLGNLTNEVTQEHGEGTYITQFVCGGPKNYAYIVSNGKKCCKIRGFTLNFKNKQILNFDSMKDAIFKYSNTFPTTERLDIVNDCKITREKWTRRLVNKCEVKSYRVVYDKRIILSQGEDTIPFGYHWSPPDSTDNFCICSPVQVTTVPDHILYTLVQPSEMTLQQPLHDMDYNGKMVDVNICSEIDIMETDNESDMDGCKSERDSDRLYERRTVVR